jgi:hypothetical protein
MNLSLQQFVQCDKDKSQVTQQLNCEYWSFKDREDCKAFCKLKNTKVSVRDCSNCQQRKPIFTSVSKKTFTNPIDEMRETLPQLNYFNREKFDQLQAERLKKQSFVDKAASYSSAELSQMVGGKVSQEVYDKRKTECMGCDRRHNPSPDKEEIGWCRSCGCSAKNSRAALSAKLWMPNLECPLKKFEKEEGTGFNTSDAIDSVKGAVTAIGNLFKKEETNEEKSN